MDQEPEIPVSDAPVILLVEDEALIRLVASDTLAEAGYRTIEACSADEALALLEAKPETIAIVTDVKMPGSLDGFGLARLVINRWPKMGIVITSAHAQPGDGDLPDHAEFLAKPYQPSLLIEAVRKVTSRGEVRPLKAVEPPAQATS